MTKKKPDMKELLNKIKEVEAGTPYSDHNALKALGYLGDTIRELRGDLLRDVRDIALKEIERRREAEEWEYDL
jgi:hypothetical protein